MSDKKTKKTADDRRNSQDCRCDAYNYFCRSALEAKNARDCSQKLLFEGGMDRKIANRTGKGATRTNKSGKNGSYEGRLGVRKVIFVNEKCSKSVCKIMLATAARSTFLKKCDTKSELEHENHERGVLQLAFLMQIRNKSWAASFFCLSLGTRYCFLKVTKSIVWSF